MSVVDCKAISKTIKANGPNEDQVQVVFYDPNKQSIADLQHIGEEMISSGKVKQFSILEACLFCKATGVKPSTQLLYVCPNCIQYTK